MGTVPGTVLGTVWALYRALSGHWLRCDQSQQTALGKSCSRGRCSVMCESMLSHPLPLWSCLRLPPSRLSLFLRRAVAFKIFGKALTGIFLAAPFVLRQPIRDLAIELNVSELRPVIFWIFPQVIFSLRLFLTKRLSVSSTWWKERTIAMKRQGTWDSWIRNASLHECIIEVWPPRYRNARYLGLLDTKCLATRMHHWSVTASLQECIIWK